MKLAAVVVHGMGSQGPGFADPMMAAISDELEDAGHDPAEVAWAPVYWADVLMDRQEAYLIDSGAEGYPRWTKLREFVVKSFGDAAGYQLVGASPNTYSAIHDKVRRVVNAMYSTNLDSTAVPLVVLAHSLGSHIISSYVWDTQKGHDTGADTASSPFERMEWLAGMITFGSNIPLFTFAHDEVLAIDFPGTELPVDLVGKARWLNFFDTDDVLGYPLRPTSPSYGATVDEDIKINVGGFVDSFTPKSHTGYWTDKDFVEPVAEFMATFL